VNLEKKTISYVSGHEKKNKKLSKKKRNLKKLIDLVSLLIFDES